jgi:glyoxylase-like metal-dependent hydrolase (beta-lactamase superfamily II)
MGTTTTEAFARGTSTSPLATEIPGLYATRAVPLSFAPTEEVRAFLLRREAGNLLIYGAGGIDADRAELARLGGVSRHLLNHRHEAAFVQGDPVGPVFVHDADRAAAARRIEIEGGFTGRHRIEHDLEVVPIPGHTPGASAFLWTHGAHRLLFTGDSLMLDGEEWVAAVLDSSDVPAYRDSLALIAELDFDFLVPWASSVGGPAFARTDRAETRRRIDAVLARLRAGGRG